MSDTSEDRFLNGRVVVRQPMRGFRAGLDAVMLAASVPAKPGEQALELGSGVGTASLCLAHRIADLAITGIEIDAGLVALANANALANGMDARLRFLEGDVFNSPHETHRAFAHAFCNPPFHNEEGETSPVVERTQALQDRGRLAGWIEEGVKRVAPKGTFTIILRSDRIAEALEALPGQGICIFPLWPKAGVAAKRVILQARKESHAPLALLPGLILHAEDGRYTAEADAILRGGASLALDSRGL